FQLRARTEETPLDRLRCRPTPRRHQSRGGHRQAHAIDHRNGLRQARAQRAQRRARNLHLEDGCRSVMAEFLSQANLARVSREVRRPGYDRGKVDIGIVHFGPGAFHRVHQAWFVDTLLASDPRWGICAVSLRSTDVRDALVPQDGLYTLAVLD